LAADRAASELLREESLIDNLRLTRDKIKADLSQIGNPFKRYVRERGLMNTTGN
jgi:acetylornithine/succinyldiaminopimelate/putrescine aminotransferase